MKVDLTAGVGSDLFDLSGSVALITGGAGDIGFAAARALAARGAGVCLLDLGGDRLANATTLLHDAVGAPRVTSVAADISRAADVAEAVSSTEEQLGPIDVLVNCAGVQRRGAVLDATAEDLELLWQVNVQGLVAVTQAVLPRMVAAGGGRIINVASLGAVLGLKDKVFYSLTKGAVAQYTRSLAVELGPQGIRANALAPGYVETRMTQSYLQEDPERTAGFLDRIPVGRFARPEDLEPFFVLLAARASEYLTGQVIVVDGGWSAW